MLHIVYYGALYLIVLFVQVLDLPPPSTKPPHPEQQGFTVRGNKTFCFVTS